MRIRVLDPITVARVAAGEVVERPASVVKELIENSIDAGASRIEVIIPGELTSLIAVVDDGSGIEFDDLPVAVMPHATLLHNDLSAISTPGFRGEALHAIAAVAHLRIVSRRSVRLTQTCLNRSEADFLLHRGRFCCGRATAARACLSTG